MSLSLKSFYIYIELIMAFIFVAVLLFVVPENFESKMTVYASFDLEESYEAMIKDTLAEGEDEITYLGSRDEVKAKLEDNRSSVGLYISSENNKIKYEYILQGYENEKFRNIIETSTKAALASEMPNYEKVTKTTTLDNNTEKLSDRLNMLPVFLVMNAAFMGLFIIASYIFLDKDEGTIKAFAVTPASVWQYLLSKVGVMLVSALMSGLIATIFIAGTKPNYLHLILLLISCNLFGSSIGLFITSFFDSMTKAMGWLYMAIITMGFSTVSYYMPSFSPTVLKVLPSYPMLFAFRETLLDRGNVSYIYANVVGFTILAIIFFLLANKRFKKTLTV